MLRFNDLLYVVQRQEESSLECLFQVAFSLLLPSFDTVEEDKSKSLLF